MTRITLQSNTSRLSQQPISLVQTIHEYFGRSWSLISYSAKETGIFFERICNASQPALTSLESSDACSTREGLAPSLTSAHQLTAWEPRLIPLLHKGFHNTWKAISYMVNQNRIILEKINGTTKPALHQPEEQPQLTQPLPIDSSRPPINRPSNSTDTDPSGSIANPPLPTSSPQTLPNATPPLSGLTPENIIPKPSLDSSSVLPDLSLPIPHSFPSSPLSTSPSSISSGKSAGKQAEENSSIDEEESAHLDEIDYESDSESISSYEDEEKDEEDCYNFDKLDQDIFSFFLKDILELDSRISLNDFLKNGERWDAEGKKKIETPLEQLNGIYTIIWPGKCIYRGKIKNGKLNGKGYISLLNNGKDLLIMSGKFEDNILRRGFFNEGNRHFEGKFIKGHATGSGSIKYWNDTEISQSFDLEYKGEFEKGRPQGKGVLLELVDGNLEVKASGRFEKGYLKEGILKLRDGRRCQGHFNSKGELLRRGIISDSKNNSKYTGEVEENTPHGLGKIKSNYIFEYDGESVHLTIKAKGRFKEGNFIEGEETFIWEGQEKVGFLTVTQNANERQELTVDEKEDEAIIRTYTFSPPPKETKDIAFLNGKGRIKLGDANCTYEGDIQNGLPHGEGKLINYEDRQIIEGSFKQGQSLGPATITDMDTNEVVTGFYNEDEEFIPNTD